MPNRRNESLPIATATALLRGLTFQAARYAERVRTRRLLALRSGIRSGNAAFTPEHQADLVAPLSPSQPEMVGELLTLIREQQAQLLAAAQRIGALEAQLAAGLTVEQARELRDELAACQAQLALQQQAPPREPKPKQKKAKRG